MIFKRKEKRLCGEVAQGDSEVCVTGFFTLRVQNDELPVKINVNNVF